MTRTRNTPATHRRRRKIIYLAKGFNGVKSHLFKAANEQLMRSWNYSFRDRKVRKRNFRKLWILRINNALKEYNISYSKFICSLKMSHIHLNRQQISEMSINNPDIFGSLVNKIFKNESNTNRSL